MSTSPQGKHLSAKEWEILVANDPVLQFVKSVEDAAVKSPTWDRNYALALYQAFGEESRNRWKQLGVSSHDAELSDFDPYGWRQEGDEHLPYEERALRHGRNILSYDGTGVISRMYVNKGFLYLENWNGVGGWEYGTQGTCNIPHEIAQAQWDTAEVDGFKDWIKLK